MVSPPINSSLESIRAILQSTLDSPPRQRPNVGLMRARLLLLAPLLLLAACHGGKPKSAVEPPAVPKVIEVFDESVTPGLLWGRVGVRGFKFESPEGVPVVSATLSNLSGSEPRTLEMSAVFRGAGNSVVYQTDWSRVTLAPGQRHQFVAQTMRTDASGASILLRFPKVEAAKK